MSERGRQIVVIFLVVFASAFLLLYRCGERDLWSSHEARAAQNAQSMLHYGDWRLPRLTDERPDYQKPPLYYWLVAGLGWLRGRVDAWSVRLPAVLAAAGCLILLASVLARRQRPEAALLVSLLLLTAHHFTNSARTGRIDMPLAWSVAVTVLCWRGDVSGWRGVGGTLSAAAGLLLKGPIGLILPLAVVGTWWIVQHRLDDRRPSLSRIGVSAGSAILLAAPWYIMAHRLSDGEFTRVFFWYHNIQRATGGADELAVHPWWYYGVRLMVDAWPPAALFPLALVWFCRKSRWREDEDARFGLVWCLSVVAVLSLARFKRADYLLPAYPGLALFLGCVIDRLRQTGPTFQRVVSAGLIGTPLVAVLAWLAYLHAIVRPEEPRRESKSFAAEIRQVAPAPNPILLFRVESHPLAFHLGRPINTLLEWENLDIWASQDAPVYVVMTPETAAQWPMHLRRGRLETVLRRDHHEKPLVLLRTCRISESSDGASGR